MPGSPRHVGFPVLAVLPLLSGCCATVALWSDEKPEPVVVSDTTVELRVRCAVTGGDELLLLPAAADRAAGAVAAWRLAGGAGADLAIALLLAGGAFEVERVDARVVRETFAGAARDPRAELTVGVRVGPALARAVTPSELPPATRAALRDEAERVDFPFTSPPAACRDPLVAECVARLRDRDFAALVGARAAPVVVAMLAVDEDLRVFAPDAPEPPADPPLRSVLTHLAPAQVLVELADGRRRHHLVLHADAAWMWASLRPEDGRHVQRSTWQAFAAGEEPLPPLQWPATLQVRDVRIEMRTLPGSVWARIALTPLTLLADCAGAWLLHQLGIDWFCGDEDEDDGEEQDLGATDHDLDPDHPWRR